MRKTIKEAFQQYSEPDEKHMSPSGFEILIEDLGLSMETIEPLLLCWFFKCLRMGFISEEEWLLAFDKAGIKKFSVKDLNKQIKLLAIDIKDKQNFKCFYNWLFNFAKAPNSKTIDLETVEGLLSVIFEPSKPHITPFLGFIKDQSHVAALNKDQWQSLLDFSNTINSDFSNYSSESAWPVLLDLYAENTTREKN
ncbi:hypothetical protein BB561_002813 [Smittium simulii]|uniref:Defective in cullin neddylation protein n=1 Tax=Smittium simulii TaxID=133385 RepID=A0A2T9YP52_9FUNG|nr:hypothetical protein BB561_002813 [Smittium simulii]